MDRDDRLEGNSTSVDKSPILSIRDLSLGYRDNPVALKNISLDIPEKSVTAIIGASGCGKSTLLRCLNRMNDLIDGVHYQGEVIFSQSNILSAKTNVTALRRQIGMVFQRPNPFPKSIFDNVAYGLKLSGVKNDRPVCSRGCVNRAWLRSLSQRKRNFKRCSFSRDTLLKC